MGLFEAKGQLDRGIKDLSARWNHTRASWQDNSAADFEKQFIDPLRVHVRNATAAMASAASFVSQAKSECADRS